MTELNGLIKEIALTAKTATLLRDLAAVVHAFHQENPDIDSLEVTAMAGALAGSLISSSTDPATRGLARHSVISTMDAFTTWGVEKRHHDLEAATLTTEAPDGGV